MPTQLGPAAKTLLVLACFVVVVAGMRAASPIIEPLLLAILVAIITSPVLGFLQRKGVPTPVGIGLVILVVTVVGFLLAVFVGASVRSFSAQVPVYQARLHEEMAGLLAWLSTMGLDVSITELDSLLDPGAVMRVFAKTLSNIGGVLTNIFLILLTVVFILLEASHFPHKVRMAFADPNKSLDGFTHFAESVKQYLAIKTLVSLATGFCVFLVLVVIGVDYPLLWALLAFLLNYVPNIGSILAAIPAVLLAFIQFGVGSASLVALGYITVNVVMGNMVEPRFMGKELGLSTLVVFLSLIFWGWVMGPVGMLLSVPLTMIVKIAMENSEETRWIAVLLGPDQSA